MTSKTHKRTFSSYSYLTGSHGLDDRTSAMEECDTNPIDPFSCSHSFPDPPSRSTTIDSEDADWVDIDQDLNLEMELGLALESGPALKRPRLFALTDLPYEILLVVLKNVDHPLDLLHLSLTCSVFWVLADERAWCRQLQISVPYYYSGVETSHLRGGLDTFRQVGMDDFIRRERDWILPMVPPDDTHDPGASPHPPPRLRIDPSITSHIKPQHMVPSTSSSIEVSPRWRNVGPPASHTHKKTHATLSAYMQARSYDDYIDHQIVLYGLDHQIPLAIIPSDFWAHPTVDHHLDPEIATGIAQLMEIRSFPKQRDDQGRMRILLVVAFGDRSPEPFRESGDTDMHIIDVWLLIKVVEVYICDTAPSAPARPADSEMLAASQPRLVPYRPEPSRGRVETIVPSSRQELVHGRIVKLYSSRDPITGRKQDRIALFGIARSQAIVMTSPLFISSVSRPAQDLALRDADVAPPSKWECHALGGSQALETSAMALFPPQSDFDHLLVIMDPKGRGQIWDWVRKTRVAVLKMPLKDQAKPENQLREHLWYWGVQVNWAIEEPVNSNGISNMGSSYGAGYRKHGDFRIVALADGQAKEWETCWWHVGEQALRDHESDASARVGDKPPSWIIHASSRHFEEFTLGKVCPQVKSSSMLIDTPPQQVPGIETGADQSLLFIAFLIWDHYRIALTTQYGICLFDMDQESASNDAIDAASTHKLPQWVTIMEDAAEDPLIDIATVGDCLFLTRKYSHMIWPFRRTRESGRSCER